MKRILVFCSLLCATSLAFAGDMPADVMARFIKQLGPVVGSTGKATLKDSEVIKALQATGGVEIIPDAKLVYCATAGEVKAWKGKSGHVLLVSKLDLLPLGGCLAVIEENGKPQIYLHLDNFRNCGVPLSDMLMRIGKQTK